MSFQKRCPVVLVCSQAFDPVTLGHLRMFEIARSFLERTGQHIVVGGVLSPLHNSVVKGTSQAYHRVEMCRLAVQNFSWLSADGWESSQKDWMKTVKVLQHQANKIKNEYGVPGPYSNRIQYIPTTRYPSSTVTLQPGGVIRHQILTGSNPTSQLPPNFNNNLEENSEINEASEPELAGVVLNRLSNNLQRVCCVQPVSFPIPDNMVYGASYDLRHTKVMLLCNEDLLESFSVPGLWLDEDIVEIVSTYGIVCIPHKKEQSSQIRTSLNKLQHVLSKVEGTVILVNSSLDPDSFNRPITEGCADVDGKYLREHTSPSVLEYICRHDLYTEPKPCPA